jgi:hypothetical protein
VGTSGYAGSNVAIPKFAGKAFEDRVGGDPSGAEAKNGQVAHPRGEATGGNGGQDYIDLGGLVAFGGLQQFEKDGAGVRREPPRGGLGGGDIVNVAPAEGKTFRGPKPTQPEEQLGKVCKQEIVTEGRGGRRKKTDPGPVGQVPVDVGGSEGRRGARFGPKPTAHPSKGHAGKQVVGGTSGPKR